MKRRSVEMFIRMKQRRLETAKIIDASDCPFLVTHQPTIDAVVAYVKQKSGTEVI